MKYLADKGIAPRRMRLSQSGIYEPVKFGQDAGLPTKNARVEIYELNELADDPTATREPRTKGPKKPALEAAGRRPNRSRPTSPQLRITGAGSNGRKRRAARMAVHFRVAPAAGRQHACHAFARTPTMRIVQIQRRHVAQHGLDDPPGGLDRILAGNSVASPFIASPSSRS